MGYVKFYFYPLCTSDLTAANGHNENECLFPYVLIHMHDKIRSNYLFP